MNFSMDHALPINMIVQYHTQPEQHGIFSCILMTNTDIQSNLTLRLYSFLTVLKCKTWFFLFWNLFSTTVLSLNALIQFNVLLIWQFVKLVDNILKINIIFDYNKEWFW